MAPPRAHAWIRYLFSARLSLENELVSPAPDPHARHRLPQRFEPLLPPPRPASRVRRTGTRNREGLPGLDQPAAPVRAHPVTDRCTPNRWHLLLSRWTLDRKGGQSWMNPPVKDTSTPPPMLCSVRARLTQRPPAAPSSCLFQPDQRISWKAKTTVAL